MKPDDAELVRRVQRGDGEAMGLIYDRYHEAIYRYLWLRLQDTWAAEDLTGDIFMRAVAAIHDYQAREVPFQAWLYRLAHNRLVDYYRRESGRNLVPLEIAEEVLMADPEAGNGGRDVLAVDQVRTALARLDPIQREVLVMRFLLGLPLREVALALDKTTAAIKSLQHRGLQALRAALGQE